VPFTVITGIAGIWGLVVEARKYLRRAFTRSHEVVVIDARRKRPAAGDAGAPGDKSAEPEATRDFIGAGDENRTRTVSLGS
jgi:hypothetical protein